MTALERVVAAFVVAILLLLLGVATGWWRAALHYGPQLVESGRQLGACTTSRGGLESQVGEQGEQLKALQAAAEARQAKAVPAQAAADQRAHDKYAAANRLQQQRGSGDACAAAEAAIDQELRL